MGDAPEDHLLDHEYDGIREYDNPCPAWWSFLFFGTFVFSVVYFYFFTFSPVAWTNDSLYVDSVARNQEKKFGEIGELKPNEQTILAYMNDEEWLAFGGTVYKAQCARCHQADGSGMVGPNMTDDKYKNVENLEDVAKVIMEGANNQTMPGFAGQLHPNEIVLVTAYVAKLRGKNLPGQSVAGEKVIPPWPVYVPAEEDAGGGAGTSPTGREEQAGGA